MNKLISIISACYNEEGNITEVYNRVKRVFEKLPQYDYEHLFIDNDSNDKTQDILRDIASRDKNVKVIFNTRNFGPGRSPWHAFHKVKGDAIISIVSDLQDPPEMILPFLQKWEEGYKIVIGVKNKSKESFVMFNIRKIFYRLLNNFSEIELVNNYTGFGLYDRSFIDILLNMNDPSPYFRGLIPEFGMKRYEINYVQPKRKSGKTKQSFVTLYDEAMLGFVSHSKMPLRLASFTGYTIAFLSLLVAVGYFVYKIVYWNEFNLGLAPLVIGVFFFSSVQLIFIGVIGEYVGAIWNRLNKQNRPLVIEKERINFDDLN
ncbi:MAG: glycosyltransferase family 2 protein [Bacteroidales bacterium]